MNIPQESGADPLSARCEVGAGRVFTPRTLEDGNRCAVSPRLSEIMAGPPLPQGVRGVNPRPAPPVQLALRPGGCRREKIYT